MNLKREIEPSKIDSKKLFPARKGLPLHLVLIVPFVLQIFAVVGITGYLSFRNGQKAVNNLAIRLKNKISNTIEYNVVDYLEKYQNFHQIVIAGIHSNNIDLENFDSLEKYFWHQIQAGSISDIVFANSQGEIIGIERDEDGTKILRVKTRTTGSNRHQYLLDSQGNRTKLIQKKEYNTLARPWYQTAVKAGKPAWSIYRSTNLLVPEISAVVPIYNQTGELEGVLGSELTLEHISNFLSNLQIGLSGQAFIMERNGELVASSTPEPITDGEERRILAQNSSNLLIQSTAKYLFDELKSFQQIQDSQNFKFKFNGEQQLVQIKPLKLGFGFDFVIVVVIPESDFMAEIHANNRTTILLCIASLLVATLLGLITSRWITRPIRRLSDASKAIADGYLDRTVEVKGVNELGILAYSFNQMASQLKASFAQLDTTNKTLETTNAELDRTNQELDISNKKLAITNQQLEIRVEERTYELQVSKEKAQKAQKAAEVANKAKSTFLANMSHELRTPLNAILGFTQIMQRDRTATRSQLENLNTINRSGEHLLALINDVLDMSKIEAGRISLNPVSFDLHRLLDTTEEMLEFKADAKGLQLLFDRHPDTPQYIRTDERKLRQVLINLLNNALKFTTEGGVTLRVSSVIGHVDSSLNTNNREPISEGVSFRTTNNQYPKVYPLGQPITIYFEIEDTGVGIAPEELDTLFEAFTQTESGRQSEEGTGLGVPISRKFVQLMGGDITVSSQLGVGTVFKFNIIAEPAIEEELQPQQRVKQVIGLQPNQPSYRILVVDDRWENRQIVCKLLQPIGFEVKEAVNGREAIEIWEQWQPHLIWMDMRMPIMNGYEATEYIKSQLKGQATYIVALTASTFEEERAIVLSAGCDDFVRKPFREAVLFDKMAEYLGVKYIYENGESEPIKADFILEPTSLEVMSSDWLTQLEQAASELDEDLIAELLNQIPDEHTLLAKALQNKVNDFDFDDIVALVGQTAKISN